MIAAGPAGLAAFAAGWLLTSGSGTAAARRLADAGRSTGPPAWQSLGRWLDRLRSSRPRRARQRATIALCDDVAAELAAGIDPISALRHACGSTKPPIQAELRQVVAAAELGGDVAGELRRLGQLPGAEGLRYLAAGWQVMGRSGASLAGILDRLAAGLRHDEEARAEVRAALGPPRATARLLAILPLLGLGLGASIGAHPLGFLLGSPAGWGCLVAGVALAVLGVWWVERLARAAEP